MGDEVIVPDLTFAATANAVIHVGAKPIFCDVDSKDWNIKPENIKSLLTEKTKAIIPVHLYGQPCKMYKLKKLAEKYNLILIEDCAESLGSKYHGQFVGSFGDASAFSFYGNKTL